MEMPQVTDEHRKMSVWAGTWQGEETLFPSPFLPEGGKAQGVFVNKMILGDFVMTMDYQQKRDEQVTYAGLGVFGYSPNKQCYTKLWSDSMAGMPEKILDGHWVDNVLTFEGISPEFSVRYSYTLHDENSFSFALLSCKDGENWEKFMEGRYTRQ